VAGDAAFTCGPVFEALNNVAAHTKKLIIVLNDNEWSIDRNVGAIAKYFNTIATHPGFANRCIKRPRSSSSSCSAAGRA
jgi:1-deoxy-D-xylulose-5-phosphate synthase